MKRRKRGKKSTGRVVGDALQFVNSALERSSGRDNGTREQDVGAVLASRFPFLVGLAGGLLLFFSFPPVGLAWLAWFATLPWLALVRPPQFSASRPWLKIWLAGLLYWAAEVYYISIPHWLLWFAWIALFAYLSIYPLLFVWLSRILVHDHRCPLIIAGPVVFTALEWVRAHLITGFGFSMLANSQYQHPLVLQICDVAGAYGLTFLMMVFAVSFSAFGVRRKRPRQWVAVACGVLALATVWGYGTIRQNQVAALAQPAQANVLVVQGSIDTRFPTTEVEAAEYSREMLEHYFRLQRSEWNSAATPRPDLIIWPEGKYPVPDILADDDNPDDDRWAEEFRVFHQLLYEGVDRPPPMIVGTASINRLRDEHFNSTLLLDSEGRITDRYFKMHRVLFGEYVPLQRWFPVLDRLTPIGKGLTPGEFPAAFEVNGLRYAPFICFESVVTHLVRDSINELAVTGDEPDVLVNVTDDGWFYGTALLDHHLSCNVLRAVENRKPMVVAANTGISALIDATGEIRVQGPRRQTGLITMSVPLSGAWAPYRAIGDWPVIALTALCVQAILTRRRGRGWQARTARQ